MFRRRHALGRAVQLAGLTFALFMTSKAFAEQTITVLYAGSLVGLMERSVAPAF
jgi:ABC-type molybdate transport system substrate-binding protein